MFNAKLQLNQIIKLKYNIKTMKKNFQLMPIKLIWIIISALILKCQSYFIAASINPTSLIISQLTSYELILYRSNDPVQGQFISPVSTIPFGSYIQLKMPPSYYRFTDVANPTCSNSKTGATLSCTVNLQTNIITINGMFSTTSTQTASTLYILINNIRNPGRAETSGNFQYFIKSQNGTVIDQSPASGYGAINFLSATFSSCAISTTGPVSTRSKFTFTITTKNSIPSGGKLRIQVPGFWNGDLDSSLTVASTPVCTSVSGLSTISCGYSYDSGQNIMIIQVSSLSTSGIVANSQIVFDVSSILTPPYTNSQDRITMYSQWSDGVIIDSCLSTIQGTIAIPFTSIIFSVLSGTNIVQSKFTGKITLNLAKSFSYLDQIKLNVPLNFLNNNQIQITSSNYAVFTVTTQVIPGSSVATVTLSNFPASPLILPAGNIFSLVLNDINNFQSIQTQTITVTFFRNQQMYQSSSTTYASTIGTLTSVNLNSDNSFVNNVGPTTLLVTSQFRMPVGTYIQILYNSDINVEDVGNSAVLSSALNGIRVNSANYQVSQNVITIDNLFLNTFSNGTIQVKIPLFKNPPTLKPTPYIIIFKSATDYPIASSIHNYQASLQPFKSSSASLTASSYKVMDSVVIYTISFETFYGYSAVSILIPPQIVTNAGFQTSCSPNTYTSCSITSMNTVGYSGYNNLTFIGSMAAGLQTVSWGNNYNPNSYKPTSNFEVYTYLNGWGVQKSTGYTTLTMNAQAQVLSGQIIPSSYTNNAAITVQINYILPSQAPTGTITITVPQIIDITNSATCSGTNIGNCIIIPPRLVISFTNTDRTTPHSSTVRLANVRNSPSFKPISNFQIALKTSDNYESLRSTIPAWTNTATSSFTTSVTSDIGYRGQNALFTFSLSGLSGTQNYVNIRINNNFKRITSDPSGGTRIDDFQVRYSIPGESSVTLSITLQAPVALGDYTFSFRTFTTDEFLMGQSVSNTWRHSCFGTQCRACNGATCLNCYNSSITQNFIFNTANSTCIRACQVGFYLQNNTTNCIPCNSNCLECVSTSTTCTKCHIFTNTTPSTVYYLNRIYSTCVLQCSAGFYANSNNQQCSACVQPCNTCSNEVICLTCINNYFLLSNIKECVSDCPADLTVENNVNRTCDLCSTNCLTCSIFVYNCTSCNNTQGLYLQGNVCVTACSSQKFLKNNICTQCQSPCRICFNSTTTCSACFPNSALSLWFQYKCISVSQCTIGHFVNSVNGSCDICPSQCLQCVSLTNCTTCTDGFYLYGNSCITNCPNITYSSNSTKKCQSCVGCVTCTSISACTSCRSIQYLYLSSCLSICPSGTFASTQTVSGVTRKICSVCPVGCPTCSNLTYCLSCLNQQFLYKGVCYETCPISTYALSPNCQDCPTTCRTCSSPSNCLTCVTNYSLQNSQCVLNCNPGISFNQVCYPCGLNCAICNNTICERCDPDYYLFNNVCVSQCTLNTLSDGMKCIPCTTVYVNCSTCNATECLSCYDGQLTNGQCLPCTTGYYTHNSKCVVCPSQCTICMNQTYCSSCSNGFYLEANFCVDVCPNNKIPNGTKCDVCIQNCAQCNLETKGCLICNAGLFQFQGNCLQQCPSPYVINLNKTLCVTQEDYALQYSKASKPIYFPFSIAVLIVIGIGIGLKCYINTMHAFTFLVSVVAWIQLLCWIVFGIIQYLFYSNLQQNALKGILLVLGAIAALVLTNLVFLRFYYKYFVPDMDFNKWERRHGCINMIFVVLGSVFSFRAHRMVYSKVMNRDQLSLQLSSIRKLTPINILSVCSILLSSGAIIAGTTLALYFSLTQDQQFFNALDTLIVTSIQVVLIILDLKHSHNYFIDEHETQNIKNKMFHEDYQQFSINNNKAKGNKYLANQYYDEQKGSNISRQNLVGAEVDSSGNIMDQLTTTKKFRGNKNNISKQKINNEELNEGNQTLRQGNFLGSKNKVGSKLGQGTGGGVGQNTLANTNTNMDGTSQNTLLGNKGKNNATQQIQYDEEQLQQDVLHPPQNLWVQKKFDAHGYLIKKDQHDNVIKYDQNGYRVQIDQNGKHHKYNEQGHQMIYDKNKKQYVPYDKNGFIVGKDGKRYDERGYQAVKNQKQNGQVQYKFYNQHGYQIIKNQQTGQQQQIDKRGNRVQIDPVTKQHKVYNKQGYQILYSKQEGEPDKFINPETGNHIRVNQKTGKWQQYDPKDNFLLIKNPQTGKFDKYDQHGFKIQYDQYGNVYRYDHDGNRVILGQNGQIRRFDKQGYEIKRDPLNGQIRRYDKDGYQVKIDPSTGEKIFYDQHGYRVQRDFYGKPTFYDSQDNMIIIDPQTKKHRKFNKQGLEIIDDGRGGTYLRDKRGRKVVQLQDGYYEKYDEVGNKIWLDQQGYEVETDQHGNITKYDKIGDVVEDQDQQENGKDDGGQFFMEQEGGDNALPGQRNKKTQKQQKPSKNIKFKSTKQYNFQQQYSKMIEQEKPNIVFNFEDQQQQDNLKQFHDVQPVKQYQLQKQYQTLYNMQTQNQFMKRQNSQGVLKFTLQELGEIDNTPYKNLKQRIKNNKSKAIINKNQLQWDEKSDIMIQPEQNHEKLEIKSVADISVSQRSFDNQGVQPLNDKMKKQEQDAQSVQQIDTGIISVRKNKKTRRSQANFEKNQGKNDTHSNENKSNLSGKNNQKGTRSEKNFVNNENQKKKQKVQKIFDSDQEVVSLGQQQNWQNQAPDLLFYKDANTHANSHTQDKGFDEEQSDILSDYIPQQADGNNSKIHKASQQNLFHKKYMQSIEQVEDQLFDKLKSQDNRVKRTQFKLSGKPNPLVQYAKTIDAKKWQQQRQKQRIYTKRQRYDPQFRNNRPNTKR